MSEFHVERLTTYSPEDAQGIGQLMPQLSEKFSGEPIPEERLRTIIESPYHEQLVARTPEKIIGAATLSLILGSGAHQKVWLEDFVSDQHSGLRGVGQALWDEMITWCEEQDADLHFTSRASREAAHAFYLKNNAKIRDTVVFKREV